MKSPLIAAALIASLAIPHAVAGSATEKFDVEIQIDRTALDDPISITSEYESIRAQISERCEAEHDDFSHLQSFIAVRSCVNKAMDDTVRQIDHEGLAQLHSDVRFG